MTPLSRAGPSPLRASTSAPTTRLSRSPRPARFGGKSARSSYSSCCPRAVMKTSAQEIHRSWLAAGKKGKSGEVAVTLDMSEWYWKFVIGTMFQVLFGKLHEEEWSRAAATVDRFFSLLGASVVGDYLPWLRWMEIGGYEKAIKEAAKEMDNLMEGLLQAHRREKAGKSKEEEDFMDAMITHFDCNIEIANGFDADTVIKSYLGANLTFLFELS
ncbi:unnamed protein product [Cuscuta epithymum]|uniref:Uncharacterized protein n=1 Tax=Cuscuta epithymum TaxID=186058 RepID=A0AAV0GAH9_9ASTE|nr:unnamed protein product [Cuscuta epithymum]